MIKSVSHIALFVPNLQEAEQYYQTLFNMNLIGREAERENDLWFTLPFDKNWEDAKKAGIELDMIALRRGGLVLALFRGDKPLGQVFVVGLSATEEEIEAIYKKLSPETSIDLYQPDRLEFVNPYYITWQIAVDPVFRTAGELQIAG